MEIFSEMNSHKLLVLLPHAIQEVFKTLLSQKFPFLEKSLYAESISTHPGLTGRYFKTLKSLPEILITSGSGSVHEMAFLNKLLTTENFEILKHPLHPMFRHTSMAHPKHLMAYIAAEPLVMVIDQTHFTCTQAPAEWYELLNPKLDKSIVFPAKNGHYGNTIYFPFLHNYGFRAIDQLKQNTNTILSPSDMLTAIGLNKLSEIKVYVMPYSYALKAVRYPQMRMVWPTEGAVAIPIQMLVKKGAYNENTKLIDFILGQEMGNALARSGIAVADANTVQHFPGDAVQLQSWDFLKKCNTKQIRNKLQSIQFI